MLDKQDIIICKDAARRIVERLGEYDLSATADILRFDTEFWREAELARNAGCYNAGRAELHAEIQREVFRLSGLQTERDEVFDADMRHAQPGDFHHGLGSWRDRGYEDGGGMDPRSGHKLGGF